MSASAKSHLLSKTNLPLNSPPPFLLLPYLVGTG
jgi:hypothetical protein